MKLFSSLTNRIFVASALLAVVSIALGIYNVNVAVSTQAENELLRGLAEARTLIEENRREQVEHFTREARLIADLPRLKAAIGEADEATARGVVQEYQKELSADLFMVTDRHGRVLVWLPEGPERKFTAPVDRLSGVPRAVGGKETSSFVGDPSGILQMVSVPDLDHAGCRRPRDPRYAQHRFQPELACRRSVPCADQQRCRVRGEGPDSGLHSAS